MPRRSVQRCDFLWRHATRSCTSETALIFDLPKDKISVVPGASPYIEWVCSGVVFFGDILPACSES